MNINNQTQSKLLVVIPCLNEEKTIEEVIHAVPREIPGIDSIEILVVDDGSTDSTSDIARRLEATVIEHSSNKGVGSAFQTAVSYAINHHFNFMVNIDGDKQFNPQDIPKVVAPVLSGKADMVTASRFIDPSFTPEMPKVKLYGNHMMSRLISWLIQEKFSDVSCGFRAYNREALLQLNLHGAFTYTQETFIDFAVKNMRILEVPIKVQYFADRKSRVAGSIMKYAMNTSKIIFKGYRDYFPLRFFWGIALLFAIPGLILATIFFAHFFRTGNFSGYLYAGFSSAFMFSISVIFFIVGIVADMLDRIRLNQERILYFLKRKG